MKPATGGYTLLELMIGFSISSIFAGIFATAAFHFYRSVTEAADLALKLDGQSRILDYLARDFKSASAGKVDQNGQRLVLELPAKFEEPGMLEPPLLGSLNQILWGSGAMTVTYSTQNSAFQRTSNGTTQVLAPLPSGCSVSFTQGTAPGGGLLPPLTATVVVKPAVDREVASISSRRTFNPRANATLLP